jgi:hypothetical protein
LDLLNGYPSVINGTHSHIKGTYSDKLLEFIYYEETKEENFKDYYIAQSNVRNILRDMNGLLDPALSEGNDSGDNQNEKIKQYLASQECEFALTLLSSFKEKTKVTNLFNERVRSAIQDLNLRINPQPLPPKVVEGEDGVITIDD